MAQIPLCHFKTHCAPILHHQSQDYATYSILIGPVVVGLIMIAYESVIDSHTQNPPLIRIIDAPGIDSVMQGTSFSDPE